MRSRAVSLLVALVFHTFVLSASVRAQSWITLNSGGDTNLRAISAAKISTTGHIAIWASGSHDVILRSLDDGATWTRLSIPGQPDLDFRGVVAFDDKTAYLMSSGEGNKSKIHKTIDGGIHWELQYTDVNSAFFLDSIACASPTNCFALGDPINGRFLLLQTTDGRRWNPLPPQNLPMALPREGAFAASNSNLLVASGSELFVVTGAFAARVLHTNDAGKTWSASAVPIAADNATSGIFSITRSSVGSLAAVGGDYANPNVASRIAAFSEDQSKTWQPPAQQPAGYRSAIVSQDGPILLAVGPSGSDISVDAGLHWKPFGASPLNALFAVDAQHVYAAGPGGTITQFQVAEPK
jgi:photosystem II stability/assembly factor-like uncharacterized protein